jgi:CheY-like chemotaxis protein
VTCVLFADDDADMRALATQLLGRRGYEVVTAGDGTEAIDMLSKVDPDLVVTDLNMPRQTGQDVCAAVRSSPRLRSIPLVLLTATPLTDKRVVQVAIDNNAVAMAKTDIRRLPDLADELIDAA